MDWFMTVSAGWTVVAVALGLLIGNGIRIERGCEADVPLSTEETPPTPSGLPTGARPPSAGAPPVGVAADGLDLRVGEERRGAPAHEDSLTAAR